MKMIHHALFLEGYLPLRKMSSDRFDMLTEHAVKDFQHDHQLPTSGIVFGKTYEMLQDIVMEYRKKVELDRMKTNLVKLPLNSIDIQEEFFSREKNSYHGKQNGKLTEGSIVLRRSISHDVRSSLWGLTPFQCRR